jgi:peroxiredoxin
MSRFILVACFLLVSAARADLKKICYDTDSGGQFCTTDNLGKIQVYIFNAGWCPDCNQEMDQMPPVYNKFLGQNVIFASLSGQDENSQAPNQAFLQRWRTEHNLPAGFIVAGKDNDFGTNFNPPGYIPFTVILDPQGNVSSSGDLSSSDIAQKVQALLQGSHSNG